MEDHRQIRSPQPGPNTVRTWAHAHRRIDRREFSLERFRPLVDLYDRLHHADHANVVIIKPAQRGVSELAINYAFFALDRGADVWTHGDKSGLNVGYLFHTEKALGDFSKERVSGMRSESDYLRAMMSGTGVFDAVGFKQIKESFLYLRGAWSENGLTSFPADVLILDEYDRMATSAVALARRRLNASMVQRELDLSTPSVPGWGIHGRYLESDRNVYVQRCEACTQEVSPTFYDDVWADDVPWDEWQRWTPERLRTADVAVRCPNCRVPWGFEQRTAAGRWKPEAEHITSLRGYWIPSLPWPQVNLTNLAVAAVATDPFDQREFARSDLGMPYESKGSKITQEMVLKLDAELPNGRLGTWTHTQVTMGIDVGSRWHYRISGQAPDLRIDVLAMGSTTTWEELSTLLTTYKVRQCIVDGAPELHGAVAFQRKHFGRVLRAYYPSGMDADLFRVKEDSGAVSINRSRAMDQVQATVAQGLERWPAAINHDQEVLAHMTEPSRVITKNVQGQEKIDWVNTKADHFFHACVYDQVARAVLQATMKKGSGPLLVGGAHTKLARE